MRGTIKELKDHSGDGAGNRKCYRSPKPQLGRQDQYGANADAPKQKCGNKSDQNDIGEEWGSSVLQSEQDCGKPERGSKDDRQAPSAAICQAPHNPAKRTCREK